MVLILIVSFIIRWKLGLYSLVVGLFVIFATPWVWNKVFQRFIKNILMPSLSGYKKVKVKAKAKDGEKINALNLIKGKVNRILGINFYPENIYYIEEETLNVNFISNFQI